jgi:serine/threonine-protein kinase
VIGATDIFLSYKSEDRARLAPLVAALEAEGFSVWWDTHIGGGSRWRQEIQEHLDGAKCVIVAWTKRSIGPDGDFVRDEASRARKRGAYLPICLDASEPPLGFGETQAVSLKGWKGDRADPRFRALADAVRRRIGGEEVAHAAAPHQRPGVSRRAIMAGGAGVAALAGVGGWLLLKPDAANAKRIAVLPFADLSPSRDQAFFSEGVAEELRAALARIGLEVIGRNSCDAVKDLDIKTAAGKLDAGHILTGSVRRSPETMRINAQLVRGSDGVERWGQSYDRAPGDAIRIQTDIAANVAQALSITLGQAGHAALTLGGTTDSVAQDLFLQSRKLRRDADGEEVYKQGIVLLDAAIARDPRYALAYAAKAGSLMILGVTYVSDPAMSARQLAEAETLARKAITIAPGLADAHVVLALVAGSQLDFEGALRHTRSALEMAPDDMTVINSAAGDLMWLDPKAALPLAERGIALDPLSGRAYQRKCEVLAVLKRYPQAIEAGRKALELSPKFFLLRSTIGDSLLLSGQSAKARAEWAAMPADDPFRLTREAILAGRAGDRGTVEQRVARMQELFGSTVSYQFAQIHAQSGDRERVFSELDNAIEVKDAGLIYLKYDPYMDPIRDDPRYAALIRKLKFP